jgi:hypothetical protein
MMPSLLREYLEATNLAHQRAQSERNPRAKQMLQDIERSYYRLVEIEKWMVDQQQYNRPFAHFGLFNGRDARTCFATREDIDVSPSADRSPERPQEQGVVGGPLSGYEPRAIGAIKR